MRRMAVKKIITPGVLINICIFSVLLRYVEPCVLPRSIQASVPRTVSAGYHISKVDVSHCEAKALHLISSDADFTMQADGTIVTSHATSVPSDGRTFSVWSLDRSGRRTEMVVHLVRRTNEAASGRILRRSKRRWALPEFSIVENAAKPFPKDIELIGSDSSVNFTVYYTISGPGVTEHPVGVFSVERESGMLKVHKPVDREEFPKIIFLCRVFNRYTNAETDRPMPVTVNVEDVNDNAPTFAGSLLSSVPEQSKPGTSVGRVDASDRDDADTDHAKIRYSLLTGTDLFSIDAQTGLITTVSTSLDREVKDKHLVTVQIKDMDGAPGGLFNTATATIVLEDINDNPPTFTKTSFAGKVTENQGEQLVLRLPVQDRDLVNTPNWVSQFLITKGNENGRFRIERDPETNEGLLYVTKPLDYEDAQSLQLEVTARNQADLSDARASWPSVPVEIAVGDEDEGPAFAAPTVRFTVKENVPVGTPLGTYAATDPETKSGAGIKYYKTSDPASWIDVDETSGLLTIASAVDRESHFVQHGVYNVSVKAVDASSKTAVGTVIVEVVDVNDHVPELPHADMVVCETSGEPHAALVVAEDKDHAPFSAPFTFELGEGHDGKWAVKQVNDTAATLVQTRELPADVYTVPLVVKDLQGMGERRLVTLRVCRCRGGGACLGRSSASLGVGAVLAMLLALALLILLCLIFVFVCGTRRQKLELDDLADSGGVLIKSNTEGPGEQLDSKLIIVPASGIDQSVKGSQIDGGGYSGVKSKSVTMREQNAAVQQSLVQQNLLQQSGAILEAVDTQNGFYGGQRDGGGQFSGGQFGGGQFTGGAAVTLDHGRFHGFTDHAAAHTWRTNGLYLQQKLAYFGAEEGGRYADDILHAYGLEGSGSPAGSVGCCSDQGGGPDDLDFLNALGPKFRTLAEVCSDQ